MNERMTILLQGNVIGKETYDKVGQIYNKYFKKEGLEQAKLDLFFTHLAMALERVSKGDSIDHLDESIIEDMHASGNYEFAISHWNNIKKKESINFPESEDSYLVLHLINIFNDRREYD